MRSFITDLFGPDGYNYQDAAEDNQKTPDLNEPYVEQPSYVQETNPGYVYGGQPSYVEQPNPYNEDQYGSNPSDRWMEPSTSNRSHADENRTEVKDESGKISEDKLQPALVSFKTDMDFGSREELVTWASERALEYKFVLVIGSSNAKNKGIAKTPVSVYLVCDRGGAPKTTATVRKTKSKKINCPFRLKGTYDKWRGVWNLEELENRHNHRPAQHLEGHAHARKLSPAELILVERLHKQNMEPRVIWETIRASNPDSLVVPKDINNAILKMRGENRVGKTPMQELEHALVTRGYVYHMRTNAETKAVEEVFFVHPTAYEMWRAFPHVLMIDATYKTNRYQMPLLQVVGVTSTLQTFCVCNAFLSKEREENFLWVLGHIKDMLKNCMLPRVIVTDRDKALMNALDKVFPDAMKMLCRWHITENIAKFCKQGFNDDDWKDFNYYFTRLCESPTEKHYEYNVNALRRVLLEAKRNRVWEYINENWLKRDKHRFVHHWTNQHLNFGQTTTNRVEGLHARLKAYLHNGNYTMLQIVEFLEKIIHLQHVNIRKSFEESLINIRNEHRVPLYSQLHYSVSLSALDLIETENQRLALYQARSWSCGCQLWTSRGLPCACRLEAYKTLADGRIPLSAVDKFWKKLNFEPEFADGDEKVDVHYELGLVAEKLEKQEEHVKRSWIQKIKAELFGSKSDKKPPVVQQDTRGRPSVKKQQERQLSGRTSSYTPSEQRTQDDENVVSSRLSIIDPGRHSSYEPKGIPTPHKKAQKPAMQRSRSTATGLSLPSTATGVSVPSSFIHGFPMLRTDADVKEAEAVKSSIPPLWRQYVAKVRDVVPDGNCGYRSFCVGMGMNQNDWKVIRKSCMEELRKNEWFWRHILDTERPGGYQLVKDSIRWESVSRAPQEKWMEFPYAGMLLAQKFGVIVVLLSNLGSSTYFPMLTGPYDEACSPPNHKVVTIVQIGNYHFIHVELVGQFPFPTLDVWFNQYAREVALPWEQIYRGRLDMLPKPPPRYVDLTSSS